MCLRTKIQRKHLFLHVYKPGIQIKTALNLFYKASSRTNLAILLILAGDIESNQGPKHQCGLCQKLVKRNDRAIQCDICDLWVHIRCENISKAQYNHLVNSENDSEWYCSKCKAYCYLCNVIVKNNDPAVRCDNCNN